MSYQLVKGKPTHTQSPENTSVDFHAVVVVFLFSGVDGALTWWGPCQLWRDRPSRGSWFLQHPTPLPPLTLHTPAQPVFPLPPPLPGPGSRRLETSPLARPCRHYSNYPILNSPTLPGPVLPRESTVSSLVWALSFTPASSLTLVLPKHPCGCGCLTWELRVLKLLPVSLSCLRRPSVACVT